MPDLESIGGHTPQVLITAYQVDERIKDLVEGALRSGMVAMIGKRALQGAIVSDYAWKVTSASAKERDEIAERLTTALEQFDLPDHPSGVYFADQWSANKEGYWHGDIHFAVSDVDRLEAEFHRAVARDTANAYLEAQGSPYRLQ
jgi:hypothetical protein